MPTTHLLRVFPHLFPPLSNWTPYPTAIHHDTDAGHAMMGAHTDAGPLKYCRHKTHAANSCLQSHIQVSTTDLLIAQRSIPRSEHRDTHAEVTRYNGNATRIPTRYNTTNRGRERLTPPGHCSCFRQRAGVSHQRARAGHACRANLPLLVFSGPGALKTVSNTRNSEF